MSGKQIIGPDDLAGYQTTGYYLTTGNLSYGAAGNTFLNNISYNGTTWNVFDPAAHLATNGGLAWDAANSKLSVSALSGRIDDTDTVKTLADIYGDIANCLTAVVCDDTTITGNGTTTPLSLAPITLSGSDWESTHTVAEWLQIIADAITLSDPDA